MTGPFGRKPSVTNSMWEPQEPLDPPTDDEMAAMDPLRTPELDAAFRLNDTDPDGLTDDEYALMTRPTFGDYGPVPRPDVDRDPA